jgi:hypothetical protein
MGTSATFATRPSEHLLRKMDTVRSHLVSGAEVELDGFVDTILVLCDSSDFRSPFGLRSRLPRPSWTFQMIRTRSEGVA